MAYNYEWPYTDPNRYNDDWILSKMKELLSDFETINVWQEEHEKAYNELKTLYDNIISGKFPSSMIDAFEKWLRKNAIDIVGELVKTVFFEIDDNGYFVAFIPESWNDIIFGTSGYDTTVAGIDFGHLTLKY